MYKDLRKLLLLLVILLSIPLRGGQNSNNLVLHFDARNSLSYNGSGNIINDLSSSNNDLKMMGGVTFVNSSNDIPHFNFDGNADYLKLNSAPFANSPNGLSNYTVITKIKIPSNSSNQYIMSLGRSTSFFNSEFIFYQRTNGKAGFWDYHNGHGFRNNSTSQSNSVIDDNAWKHVAFVKSGTVGKFYINGSLDRTVNAAKNVTSLNSQYFYIGGDVRDSNSWLNGKIASAKLFTAALSASDILSDFNSSNALYNTPPSYLATSALLAYYPFDSNFYDQVPPNKNGTADAVGNTNNASTAGSGFQKVGSGALNLDGTDDFLKLGSGVWFNLGTGGSGMTVSFWLKPIAKSQNAEFQILSHPKTEQFQFQYHEGNQKVYFKTKPGNNWTTVEVPAALNEWAHFTGVYEITGGNHMMKLYKNASLQASLSLGSNPQHTTDNSHPNIHIGAIRTGGSGNPIEEYKGGIDDLAIWQTALNQDQIFQAYRYGQGQSLIYFENGTCKCPNAIVGDRATINGTVYTAVGNSTIQAQVNSGNVNLCTTKVTNMSGVFNSKTSFNSNINFWDTSNVTDMNAMFYNATSFNQDISNWDTSKVVNMHRMFYLARVFNQPIGNWNTSSVNNMSGMFDQASVFNQDIGSWNTANLINNNNLSGGGGLIDTFKNAAAFNQNLSGWCVPNIGSLPNGFKSGSPLSNDNTPVWGSCPSGSTSVTLTDSNGDNILNFSSNRPESVVITATFSKGMTNSPTIKFVNPDSPSLHYTQPTAMTKVSSSTWTWTLTVSNTTSSITLNTKISAIVEGIDFQGQRTGSQNTLIFTLNPFIYFENGTCKCPAAQVGDTAVIGGKTYTVVDRAGLQTLTSNGADVTGVCTSKITNMEAMFNGKYNRQFNQDVSHYDVSNVTNFKTVFAFQPLFNQDLSKWDTSKGELFFAMFLHTLGAGTAFNQDIGRWDMSSATDIWAMLYGATSFNKDISGWDLSSVTRIKELFRGATSFNKDISTWDVSNITNMDGLFHNASAFNQDLSGWCVSRIGSLPSNFKTSSPLSNNNTPAWGTCPSDQVGPRISYVEVTPSSTNITTDTKVITVSCKAIDRSGVDLNWIRSNRISLDNANFGSSVAGKPSINFGPWILIDGDAQNGTYAASTTLTSPTHPTGDYRLNGFSWKDVNGYTGSPTYVIPRALALTNSTTTNFNGPTIGGFTISPTIWGVNPQYSFLKQSNVTTDTQIITVNVVASSTNGIDLNWIRSNRISFNRIDNTTIYLPPGRNSNSPLIPINLGPWILISGSAQDGTFAASTTISSITHYTGTYYPSNFSWKDVNGITGPTISSNSNSNLHYSAGAVSVINSSTNQDFIGPSLSNVVVSPNITGVSTPSIVTVSVRATDTSGVDLNWIRSNRIGLSLTDSTGAVNSNNVSVNLGPWILTNGTAQDGTFAASTTLSSVTHPAGSYLLNGFSWRDVNNAQGNTTANIQHALTITNSCSTITPSYGLDVSQTFTGIDINSDGTLTAGEAIRYNITVTNSGNSTLTGLDFDSAMAPSGFAQADMYSVADQSKYISSSNAYIISPGGQAAFTHTHTITYRDTVNGTLKNSLYVTAYPVCGGSITDVSDDGNDSDGNTTNDSTNVSLAAPTPINLDSFLFYNQATGSGLTAPSGTNTKVLSSQTVSFRAVINDSTVVSPVLSIHWFSAATTTTANFSVYQNIQPDTKIALTNSLNQWFYSWTVSPGLMTQFLNHPVGYNPNNRIITATVSDTNQYGVPISTTATNLLTFTPGQSRIYFENNTCKCEGVSAGATATINGTTYTVVDNSTIASQTSNGNVNLCTSLVTNMNELFKNNSNFNSNIGFWDTSNVTTTRNMFESATSFNQNIGNWDVSNVEDMNHMFKGATSFNQNIGGWNVSKVSNMSSMFKEATNFNQNIGNWNVSGVHHMNDMFVSANNFNQPIGNWNVSSATNMAGMFTGATSFNQNIGNWNVSNVTNMQGMFKEARSFNGPIGNWNTSNVTNMQEMFSGAWAFDQPIGNWNTSKVTNMVNMFISARGFKQPIGNWDVSSVTNMGSMFRLALLFNQNLSNWCVTGISSTPSNFATSSALASNTNFFPRWGTCPTGISTPTGAGTNSNPYLISTLGELRWISQDRNRWGLKYKQIANINADPSINFNNGDGFKPIGNTNNAFTGRYDGQGFWIDDLHINRGSSSEIGLFGVVSNGQIINVRLFDASIIGNNRVAVLAGDVTNNSTISSITIVESSVTGSVTVGGVIGRTSSTGIHEYLAYSGKVSAIFNPSIANPSSQSVGRNAGGIIGKMQNNTILKRSYFNGNVSGLSSVGGVVGTTANSNVFISNCYSIGNVSGYMMAGGFMGVSFATVSNSFTSSVVSSTSNGMYASFSPTSFGLNSYDLNNYYNASLTNSSTLTRYINGASQVVTHTTGKTTQQLKSKDTFVGWDFDNTWIISGNVNNGFPFLRGNNEMDLVDFVFLQQSSIGSLTFAHPLYSGTGTQSLQASDVFVRIYDPDNAVSLTSSNPLNFQVSYDNKSFMFGCSPVGIPSGNEELRIGPAYSGTNSSSTGLSTTTIFSGGDQVQANRYLSVNLVAPPSFTVSVTQEKKKKGYTTPGSVEWTYFVQNSYGPGRSRLYIDNREFSSQGVKPEDLTHLQYADIYDGPVIYKSGGYTGWGIYEVPSSFSAITSSTYGSNVIRNMGTGQYALRLEFTFSDLNDTIVEPGETVSLTAEFFGSLLNSPTIEVEYVISEATTTTARLFDKQYVIGSISNPASNTWSFAWNVKNTLPNYNSAGNITQNLSSSNPLFFQRFGGIPINISVIASDTFGRSPQSTNASVTFKMANIYLDQNGVTVKCPTANVSDTAVINGKKYIVVDEQALRTRVTNGSDVSCVCTSKVTNMSLLFKDKTTFNGDMSSWDTSNVVNMQKMFQSSSFTGTSTTSSDVLSYWDTSSVNDMSYMFSFAASFTGQLSNWDTSNVSATNEMFRSAHSFNGNIGAWDVSKVTNMYYMFQDAKKFDQYIGSGTSWTTSSVINMEGMFYGAISFNHAVGMAWNTSNVRNMKDMFRGAVKFEGRIDSWNTSNVTNMANMFRGATDFNHPVSSWNTSSVTDMRSMFQDASLFNQPIGNWDTSNVTRMEGMFNNADAFNQDIGNWNTSKVTNMYSMFRLNSGFNKDIGNWDTSNVTNFSYMFNSATAFNQDIGRWNTSKATNMTKMFRTASAFNQDLSGWCVPNISSLPDNFKAQSPLSNDNTPVWGTCPSPSVSLTHNLPPARTSTANSSESITITAQFSASMSSSPTVPTITISHGFDGGYTTAVVSNTAMTRVSSSTWSYTMNTNVVTTTVSSITARVAGVSVLGRTYVGTETLVIYIDRSPPSFDNFELLSNGTFAVTFTEPIYSAFTSRVATGTISAQNISLSLTGGTASLASQTPTSVTASGTNRYLIGYSTSGSISGSEKLIVKRSSSNPLYDKVGNELSSTSSYVLNLLDDQAPFIISAQLNRENSNVGIVYNENIFGGANTQFNSSTSSFTTYNLPTKRTNSGSWSPWTYDFNLNVPSGYIVTKVQFTFDAVDQGWGGTNGRARIKLNSTEVGSVILTHSVQSFDISNARTYPDFNYNGANSLKFYFIGYPGWSSTTTNGVLKVFYTPISVSGGNYQLSMTGGNATLSANRPSSFSLENNIVNLGLPIQGTPNGQEVLSINIPGNSVYDSTGNAATSTLASFTLYNKGVSQISTSTLLSNTNSKVLVTFSKDIGTFGIFEGDEPNNTNGDESKGQIFPGGIVNDHNSTFDKSHNIIEFNFLKRTENGYSFIGDFEGHSYFISDGISTWDAANTSRNNTQGYLTVIKSQAEKDFIFQNVGNRLTGEGGWIGLYQDQNDANYSEPAGGWKWVTGGYANVKSGFNKDAISLSISGGTASLTASVPVSIVQNDARNFLLELPITGDVSGQESVTINILANSLFDVDGNSLVVTQTNNSVRLRDTKKPVMVLTHNKTGQNVLLKGGDTVALTARSDEPLGALPLLTFSGLSTTTMSAGNNNTWSYSWNVPTNFNGTVTASVEGIDTNGNKSERTNQTEIYYTIDNIAPFVEKIKLVNDSVVRLRFNEKIYKSNNSTATLDNVNYFKLSTSQGSLTLKSSTPESLKQNESEVDLEFGFTGTPSKGQMLEVELYNTIFDLAGNYTSSLVSNTTVELKVDSDGDGVKDELDKCPGTPAGEKVDPSGCSRSQFDNDRDGIPDYLDQCPATPGNEAADRNGCSPSQKDDDNDGVNNKIDICPGTPKGEKVDSYGCTREQSDTDRDGVHKADDLCPDTPKGRIVDDTGCAIKNNDEDFDGVPNEDDRCPDTPPGDKVDDKGCSLNPDDQDLDGVLNEFDECPDTPIGVLVDDKGCSKKQRKELEDLLDDDGDGVPNPLDRCPDTPAGTIVDISGCSQVKVDQIISTDSDLDGVPNEDDLCPDTERGVKVDAFGCRLDEKDSDFDKVPDEIDFCPNTPIGEPVDANGCSKSQKIKDLDLDGVPNEEDRCPDTPFGAPVNQYGCSPKQVSEDRDMDGVPDEFDFCPKTNLDDDVDINGCAKGQLDDDKDGVINDLDRCPDTPEKANVDEFGCELTQLIKDDDGDGVRNELDLCPGTPAGASVDKNGCTFKAPKIFAHTFNQLENKRDDDVSNLKIKLGEILVEDTNKETNPLENDVQLRIVDGGDSKMFRLEGRGLYLVSGLDYETKTFHTVILEATNNLGISSRTGIILMVGDIPNSFTRSFFNILVFNVANEVAGPKVDHNRYYNPKAARGGVGRWKIKKQISGGNDAHLFEVKSRTKGGGKSEDSDDYLSFINPPDFENPQDHNKDGIYEVEVININTADGEATMPIVVTQSNIVVPENDPTAIQLQAVPASAADDSDGDGISDILDNSPFVPNPDQSDEDGDGVGDATDDADHDGVWNPYDTCEDTPYDTIVDAEGCPIFYLAPNSFTVNKSEKCEDQNSIRIGFNDNTYKYNISVNGVEQNDQPIISSSWEMDNLISGNYQICITVEGQPKESFERCYNVNVNNLNPLNVFSKSPSSSKTIKYSLSGSGKYIVTHNGNTFETTDSEIEIKMESGLNNIKITTGVECQGVFEKNYFNSESIFVSPVPFDNEINVFVGGTDRKVLLELFNANGRLIITKTFSLDENLRNINLDTSGLPQGSYILKVNGQTVSDSKLIIKE